MFPSRHRISFVLRSFRFDTLDDVVWYPAVYNQLVATYLMEYAEEWSTYRCNFRLLTIADFMVSVRSAAKRLFHMAESSKLRKPPDIIVAIVLMILAGCASNHAIISLPTAPSEVLPQSQARFILSDLIIAPTEILPGEKVTYSVNVSNIGSAEGSYTAIFKYKSSGGSIGSDNVEVTLKPGQTKTATLTSTGGKPGTYFISVGNINSQYSVTLAPALIRGVPATSASAITSPPSSMVGINTHTEMYGQGANPEMITLGPKVDIYSEKPSYATKHSMAWELKIHGTPILAPIDMVLVGFRDLTAAYRIGADGIKQAPFDDLNLYFESTSPDWPGMIIYVYHLSNSPLLTGHNQNPDGSEVEEWGSAVQTQGQIFFPYDDSVFDENNMASTRQALIGYRVKRGELIGFAGSVGTHSFVDIGFKVSDTSKNPTVQIGNPYLHWVQPGLFFYWKSYSPDTIFPSGVLAYPFECDGYQLPAEQRKTTFKYQPNQ